MLFILTNVNKVTNLVYYEYNMCIGIFSFSILFVFICSESKDPLTICFLDLQCDLVLL